jgi:hypothetical protein
METTTFTNPIIDAYIDYQSNREKFKSVGSIDESLIHASNMGIAFKAFIDECQFFYSQKQNQN